MTVEIDYKQIVGAVKERNRYFRALQEIQKIAESLNENNFEAQSKLIAEVCKAALKKQPNKISKAAGQFPEQYDYDSEYILSGEFAEQFQF